MLDVVVAALAVLGIRSDLAIAAAFGAAFLVLYRHPTPRQAMGAVAGGVGTAIYLTPIAVRALHNSFTWFPVDAHAERAVALLWGLLGTFFLAGLIVIGERWKRDPAKTLREVKQ
jgi:drug/metabolite transporter (DMT)-like permease